MKLTQQAAFVSGVVLGVLFLGALDRFGPTKEMPTGMLVFLAVIFCLHIIIWRTANKRGE